ncbi:MAG: M48 family metalloprotease [Rhodospirillales bacterium]
MVQRVARTLVSVVSALLVFLATVANAQERGRLIRDTEIEATIAAYAAPLLSAAGLDANAVRFYIVNSPVLNAFVAGGQNLFISTGLLVKSEDASQVIGVMSHEFGHMTGGHLARLDGALKDAFTQSIIGQLIAVAAGVLAGNAGAAAGISLGSNQMVQRSLLSFTRAQEQAADQAGLTFLDQSHQSARGLLRFLEILGDQEALLIDRQDAYVVTHPLTRDRVEFVRHHVETSKWSDQPIDPVFAEMHRRMVAKLAGFLGYPSQTLRTYPATDTSVYGRYARAIAYYRMPDLAKALAEIDSLIAQFPRDPYFQELKAQILFENGRIAEALPFNEAAVRLSPTSPLLRVSLAHNLIELNKPESDKRAIAHLEEALRNDRGNALGWRLAATAYGRSGDMGMSSLSLAEYSLQTGRYQEAVGQAQRAERLLPRGSPGWLRSQDILDLARREAQKQRERGRR